MNIIEEILRLPDMTGVIKARKRPVLLYGMGNGAELTDAYLKDHGIIPDGVFASDGFVRGQSFMGRSVLSVTEAEREYGDFTAVLSFALEGEKRSVAYGFAENHFLVCPSLCPFGGAYDADFVKKNADALAGLHERLADDASKNALGQLLRFAVTGDPEYTAALPFSAPQGYISHSMTHIDIGAYDGTTALEYLRMNKSCREVVAFEPDPIAFGKLTQSTAGQRVRCVNAAVTDRSGTAGFSAKGSRASSLGGGTDVKTVSLDGFFGCKSLSSPHEDIGSIRIDGEGSEDAIFRGAANLIYTSRPSVCTAVYHRADDILTLPRHLEYQLGSCDFFLEVKPYIPAFDVFLYAIPKNPSFHREFI